MDCERTKCKILLITNKGWSNIGDQVVEKCNRALIRLAMENLGIRDYEVESCDASVFPKEYVSTGDASLLKEGETLVQNSDIVIFGGGPMFNYRYEKFYGMTEAAIRIAGRYDKPVIFSGIGVELYDEENEKCQFLKKALNEEKCVLQVTARDDFRSLEKYRERENLKVSLVADPAVFCADLSSVRKPEKTEKTVGIVLIRERAFVDNGYDFDGEKYRTLLKNLMTEMAKRGYNCRFMTNGYIVDDAFLQRLIDEGIVPEALCERFVNSPEDMYEKICACDAVISTRLHPSIISYSFEVPAVGIVWNPKVAQFYDNIGHPERAVPVEDLTAEVLCDRVIAAVEQGIVHDAGFRYSIYRTLFEGIQRALAYKNAADPEEAAECRCSADENNVGTFDDTENRGSCEDIWSPEELRIRMAGMSGEYSEDTEAYLEIVRNKLIAEYRRQNMTGDKLTASKQRVEKLKQKNTTNTEKLAKQKEKTAAQKDKIAEQKEIITSQRASLKSADEQIRTLQNKLAEKEKQAAKMKAQLDRINSFWLVRLYRKVKRMFFSNR